MQYMLCYQTETGVQSEVATDASHEESSTTETTNDNEDLTSVLPPSELTADDPDIINVISSLTLPRIEHVLRSEGVRPLSITQQIDSLRKKVARSPFSSCSFNSQFSFRLCFRRHLKTFF